MKLLKAENSDFLHIKNFLLPYEQICVTLCAYVRKKSSFIYAIILDEKINTKDDILAVFYINGTILHCIPKDDCRIYSIFENFIKDKKIKSINGEKKSNEKLTSSIFPERKPFQINSYKLMTLEKIVPNSPEKLSCDTEIWRCTEDDLELLFDLQKQYITKEVAPIGKQVSDLEVKISLRNILKNQLVFALFDDGKLVSKSNTNAIGWNFIQIGGVFTHPFYRKNYYAWNLLKILCDRIQKNDKKICLFVKEKNLPAIKLYQKLGFSETNSFEIAYFS